MWFTLESKSLQDWLRVCTKCGNLYKLQTLQNDINLNFSLCIILFVCYRVATLEDDWSLRGLSTDKKYIAIEYWSLVFNNIYCIQLSNWEIKEKKKQKIKNKRERK